MSAISISEKEFIPLILVTTYNSSMSTVRNKNLNFIGLDTSYPTANGKTVTRLHLDGAASPLACTAAFDAVTELLPHYSNTHSYVHSSAKISTEALAWAHAQILAFVNAPKQRYASIFSGAGTTSAVNRVARGLHGLRPDKKVVLISSMEHHANDLPHRQYDNQVRYIPLTGDGTQLGAIDLKALEELLVTHSGQVNYIAVSSVSNVTGISNPIAEMAKLAHQHGALILVDGAQSVAHVETNLETDDVDFFIFSGHKFYTPMSPGVMIAKQSLLSKMSGQDLGGGSVATVSYYDYELLPDYPDREQAGTPNIVGAVALANVAKTLKGQAESVRENEKVVISKLFNALNDLPDVTVYGDHLLARTGALAFNHQKIDHGLLAAILNDYYAIAVRNECFCAHPYVSSLLKQELWDLDLSGIAEEEQESYINRKRGMVRASISAYNTSEDIDRLVDALNEIERNISELEKHYKPKADGSYIHTSFELDWSQRLSFL